MKLTNNQIIAIIVIATIIILLFIWNPWNKKGTATSTSTSTSSTATSTGITNNTGTGRTGRYSGGTGTSPYDPNQELKIKKDLVDAIISKYKYNTKYPNGLNSIRKTLMAMEIHDLNKLHSFEQTVCDCSGYGIGNNNWVFAGHGHCAQACGAE